MAYIKFFLKILYNKLFIKIRKLLCRIKIHFKFYIIDNQYLLWFKTNLNYLIQYLNHYLSIIHEYLIQYLDLESLLNISSIKK